MAEFLHLFMQDVLQVNYALQDEHVLLQCPQLLASLMQDLHECGQIAFITYIFCKIFARWRKMNIDLVFSLHASTCTSVHQLFSWVYLCDQTSLHMGRSCCKYQTHTYIYKHWPDRQRTYRQLYHWYTLKRSKAQGISLAQQALHSQ